MTLVQTALPGVVVAGPAQCEQLVVNGEGCREPVLVGVQRQFLGTLRPDTADQLRQQGTLPAHDLDHCLDLRIEHHLFEDRVAPEQERCAVAPGPAFGLLRQAQTDFAQAPRELERRRITNDRVALGPHLVDVGGQIELGDPRRHLVRQVEGLARLRQSLWSQVDGLGVGLRCRRGGAVTHGQSPRSLHRRK